MKLYRPESEIELIFATTELAGNKPARHQNLLRERKGKKRTGKNILRNTMLHPLPLLWSYALQGGKLSSSMSVKSTYQ